MTIKDKEAIQRMLGRIEGIAFLLDHDYGDAILDALEVIDSILDKEKGGGKG
jgi:hypothetical protein